MRTLDNINFSDKRVLLRLDLNSEVKNGKLVESARITEPLITIKELAKKSSVVILAHQGRPGSNDFISLKQHAKILSKYIKVKFVPDTIGKKAISEIKSLKKGEALLLENVRFLKEEFKPSKNNRLVKTLAPLFDIYVNDAFSTSHRNHTSITGFPKVLPSAIGRVFEKELKSIEKLNVKNAIFILGGSKPGDNIMLLKKKNKIFASGLFGPFCLMALGYKISDNNMTIKVDHSLFKTIRKDASHIIVPVDVAVENKGKREDIVLEDLPTNKQILDLGKRTIKFYTDEIMNADAVFLKGLAGLCNKPEFSIGTKTLLKAIEKTKAFTVVSGGNTLAALDRFKINKKKIGYISLSGGALIHYLAGQKLPGIEALK